MVIARESPAANNAVASDRTGIERASRESLNGGDVSWNIGLTLTILTPAKGFGIADSNRTGMLIADSQGARCAQVRRWRLVYIVDTPAGDEIVLLNGAEVALTGNDFLCDETCGNHSFLELIATPAAHVIDSTKTFDDSAG